MRVAKCGFRVGVTSTWYWFRVFVAGFSLGATKGIRPSVSRFDELFLTLRPQFTGRGQGRGVRQRVVPEVRIAGPGPRLTGFSRALAGFMFF